VARSKLLYKTITRLWPLGKVVNWMGTRPLLGPLLRPLFSEASNEAIIIPVHTAVQGSESVVLPYPVLSPLVEQASVRFLMNTCMCRQGENCQAYPHDVGCLFLGDGAAEINPALGRMVNAGEALAHARQAIERGLVPLIAHNTFDAYVLGIPYRRMLALCFCCDCCCAVRMVLRDGPPAFWDTVLRVPGLSVTVGEACVSCGACLDVCPVEAISLTNGRAHIDDRCKGCGRCVAACPAGAISLQMAETVNSLEHLTARIARRTDIGLRQQQLRTDLDEKRPR
jgi:UDP-glucose 4-epimerase